MASSTIRQRVRRARMPRPSLRAAKRGKLQSGKIGRDFRSAERKALHDGDEALLTALRDVVIQRTDRR